MPLGLRRGRSEQSEQVRVAVYGCGSMGLRHIRNLQRLGADVEAVDTNKEAFRRAGVPWAATEHVFDAIVIATPADGHRLRGCPKPHFVEKPLSTDPVSARSDFRCDEGHAPLIQIGYQFRFDRGLAALRQTVRSGDLGRVLFARFEYGYDLRRWRSEVDPLSTPYARSGILLEASHELDMARWIFGDLVMRSAWIGKRGELPLEVEDTAMLVLESGDGTPIEVHLDMTRPDHRRRIEIIGTLRSSAWRHDLTDHMATDALYFAEMQAFIWAVRSGSLHPDAATFEDGIAALRLVEEAKRMALGGASEEEASAQKPE